MRLLFKLAHRGHIRRAFPLKFYSVIHIFVDNFWSAHVPSLMIRGNKSWLN